MTAHKFRIGDPVWAKMKGFSPWPGKVCVSLTLLNKALISLVLDLHASPRCQEAGNQEADALRQLFRHKRLRVDRRVQYQGL